MANQRNRNEQFIQFSNTELYELLTYGSYYQIETYLTLNPHLLEMKFGSFKQTVLFYSLKYQDPQRRITLLNILIKLGVNTNFRNQIGQAPLFFAVSKGYQKQCEILLQAGANPHFKDDFSKTVLQYAEDFGHFYLKEILESYQFRSQPETKDQPTQKHKLHKRRTPTYALCRLPESGHLHYVTQNQMNTLIRQKFDAIYLLKNPNQLPSSQLKIEQNQYRVGLKIVEKLLALKDSSWFLNVSEAWRVEGERRENPRVDLNLMRVQLQHRLYKDATQLRQDILSIWQFAKKRLGQDHQITKLSNQLCANFQRQARQSRYNDYIQ